MILWIFITVFVLGVSLFYILKRHSFIQKQLERSLKMVPLEIKVPPETREEKERSEETSKLIIAKAESVFAAIHGVYGRKFSNLLVGAKHFTLEIVGDGRYIKIFVVVPISILESVQKAILGVYPDAEIKEVEEHNIFSREIIPTNVVGGELKLTRNSVFPLKTYKGLDVDVLQSLTTSLTKLKDTEGAAVQILLRPTTSNLSSRANRYIKKVRAGRRPTSGFMGTVQSATSFAGDIARSGSKKSGDKDFKHEMTPRDEEMVKGISEKVSKPLFSTAIRIVASSPEVFRSKSIVEDIKGSLSIMNHPSLNSFTFKRSNSGKKLATDFIFRFFPMNKYMTLNSEELATIFHLQQAIETPHLAEAPSKKAPAPVDLPSEGITLGQNDFRGEEREVKLAQEEKRRHVYILGQTGTGKSTLLQNMILQDIRDGQGVGVVDPHGDLIEAVLGQIPANRVDDVIIFDPGDLERPMGLNLFEFKTEDQKDFLIQETINMFYALYDPGHTGIVGPRMEHWFRNGALTLMADPEGASFLEVPKVFTDNQYLRTKLKYLDNQVVMDFWTQEMAQTSDFHKSEILGWFNSKFGAFTSNTMMRNIIGQHKSAFDMREVMDNKKILLVNLSKGKTGEVNSRILGMIFIMKAQAAAMSRVDQAEEDRTDFTLYVDEFQNFTTDSIATILSEARKYRLSLVMANQFIGQLTDNIKSAVFGNVGTVITLRVGVDDAEYMARQLTPVFNEQDLIQMPNFNTAIRLMVKGVPSKPFTLNVTKPWEKPGFKGYDKQLADNIRELSRLKFGREEKLVSAEIDRFLGGSSGGGVGSAGMEAEKLKG